MKNARRKKCLKLYFGMNSNQQIYIERKNKYSVVSTNKRSQAEVFKVYFSLKYLECNNYNIHFTLNSLT